MFQFHGHRRLCGTAELYIIAELRERGYLTTEPNKQQMWDLSDLLYQHRLKHSIDIRLKDLGAQTAVSAFLETGGLLSNRTGEIQYLIGDVWDWFPRFSRRFGLTALVGPGVAHWYAGTRRTRSGSTETTRVRWQEDSPSVLDTVAHWSSDYAYLDDLKFATTMPYVEAIVDYARPFDLRWQLDADATVRYYLHSDADGALGDEGIVYPTPEQSTRFRSEFKGFYEIGCAGTILYIHNSRTSGHLTGQLTSYTIGRSVTLTERGVATNHPVETISETHVSFSGGITYRIRIPTDVTLSGSYRSGIPLRNALQIGGAFQDEGYSLDFAVRHYIL